MPTQYSPVHLAAWWCMAVAAIAACGVTLGATVNSSAIGLFAFVMLTPALVMMGLWRGRPSPSMLEDKARPAKLAGFRR